MSYGGLSGLEQYSLEKAGYFIRRTVVSSDLIRAAASAAAEADALADLGRTEDPRMYELLEVIAAVVEQPEVAAIAADLFPASDQGIVVCLPGLPDTNNLGTSEWSRGFPLFVHSTEADLAAVLHGREAAFSVEVPLAESPGRLVLPGSHVQPLTNSQLRVIDADPSAHLPEAVRMRAAAGDVLVYSTSLMTRVDAAAGSVPSVTVSVKRAIRG